MLRTVVLVSGGGTNLQALLDAKADGRLRNASIVRVVSSKSGAYALERARKAGVEACAVIPADYPSKDEFFDALLLKIQEAEPDLIVLAGFLLVLPEKIIKSFKGKIINIHPSLIPSFCGPGFYGLKVHEAALERGVKLSGATVHFVDEGCDSGPIILQKAVQIKEGDTPEILQKRIMEEAEWKLLPEAVELIAEGRVSIVGGKTVLKEGIKAE